MADAFDEMVLAIDVRYFASTVLLEDYKKVAALIYPKPRYREFNIPKKSGGKRAIAAPRKKLKILQQRLLGYLVAKIDPPKACVHGFVPGRSVVTNASKHSERNPRFILNVDLEIFFQQSHFIGFVGFFSSVHLIFRTQLPQCWRICVAITGFLLKVLPLLPSCLIWSVENWIMI